MQPNTLESLRCVESLRAGRTEAKKTDLVQSAPMDDVEKTLVHLPPTLQAMVRSQLLTAARPGQ